MRCPTDRCDSISPGRRWKRTCTFMADSTDSIRKAAADAIKSGGDVARRVQEVTLEALRNLVSTGRGMADHEVKDALAGLKKIEQDFIETVSKVASSANERVRPEMRELVERATNLGTETGKQTAKMMAEFT